MASSKELLCIIVTFAPETVTGFSGFCSLLSDGVFLLVYLMFFDYLSYRD